MQWYKLLLAYDGTDYAGFQQQDGVPTVSGTLVDAFGRAFEQPVSLVAASRTDAGVHAYGQVARICTPLMAEPHRLREVWSRVLPGNILIRSLEAVAPSEFHPQHNVLNKTYWYHIFTKRPLPFMARYGWYYSRPFDLELLRACLSSCVGTHDFRSFCTGDQYESTVRTITGIQVVPLPRFHAYRIVVQGPSFLYKMVRRIVGSALHVASRSQLRHEDFCDVFHARNPEHYLTTAPAQGLLLRKIVYEDRMPSR